MNTAMEKACPLHRRIAGIDLLRVVAAYYIIVLHIVLRGGLNAVTADGSPQNLLCRALVCCTYCGVNIFGLISGYVGYSEESKPHSQKNYLSLWLEVVFYDTVLTLLSVWLYPSSVEKADLISMVLPVVSRHHWYFTAYTVLFLFIPLLNSAVRGCGKATLLVFLAAIVLFFSPIEALFGFFSTSSGYSAFWLIILYLTGAILKKTQLGSRIHPVICLAFIILLNLLSWLTDTHRFEATFLYYAFSSGMVDQFVFPCHLLSAIFHVLLFAQLKPGRLLGKFISFAGPGAFAVYLINTQRHVTRNYMTDHFAHWAGNSPLGILARVLCTAAGFILVSLLIDYFRRKLFRLCRRGYQWLSCTMAAPQK